MQGRSQTFQNEREQGGSESFKGADWDWKWRLSVDPCTKCHFIWRLVGSTSVWGAQAPQPPSFGYTPVRGVFPNVVCWSEIQIIYLYYLSFCRTRCVSMKGNNLYLSVCFGTTRMGKYQSRTLLVFRTSKSCQLWFKKVSIIGEVLLAPSWLTQVPSLWLALSLLGLSLS